MLTFYADPIEAYNQIAATISEGQKYTQDGFDYQGKTIKRLEEIYPTSPVFDQDGADSWEVSQGSISNCMLLSDLTGLARSKGPYTVKDCLYPNTASPIGLYLASIADGLERKWFAFDSNVPVGSSGKPSNARGIDGATIWPALMEKAAAVLKGNSYAALDASVIQSPNFYWIPSISVPATTFEEVLKSVETGGYGRAGFNQQKDASGAVIKIPGLVMSHAFGLVDALQVGEHRLVRISNPWGGGVDFVSPLYADDAQFWIDRPELASQRSATSSSGEFWMGWDELMQLGNVIGNKMRQPLPFPGLTHTFAFDATFTDATATIRDWPSAKDLRPLGMSRKITLTEPTDIAIATSWQPGGSGPRHSYALVTDGTATTELMDRGYGWWGGDGFTRKVLPAGTYEITPAVVGPAATRGTVQLIVLSSNPIE
jgi:hypothetical protein